MPSTNLTKTRNPQIRRLSTEEMQERRSRSLCFNCDEKFVPGHRCRKLLLIEGIYAEDDVGEEDNFTKLEGVAEEELRISLHAITGSPTSRTMRVQGRLSNHRITTLMDTGSTHNFLNSELAERLGLKPRKKTWLLVTVANGERLECRGVCHGMLLWLQGELFTVDFFLLPLEGCDAVLGTQWLRELGPFWLDFARLLMNFKWKGRDISLRGVEAPVHQVVDNQDVCRELKRKKVSWLCQLMPLTDNNNAGKRTCVHVCTAWWSRDDSRRRDGHHMCGPNRNRG